MTSSGNITINLPTASATNRGLLSAADWTTFNNKADAGDYVTLGTAQTITAQKTFTTSGSSDTMIISHGSGSGFALDVLKAGNGEAIRVTKTSGSGNAMTISGGNFEAGTIVKTGGTSVQYLMADGSVSTLTNPVTGTGAAGQVAFWNGTTTQTGSLNLIFDSTNINLGIGVATAASIDPTITSVVIRDAGSKVLGSKTGVLAFQTSDASFTGTYADAVTAEIYSVSENSVGSEFGIGFLTSTITGTNRAERWRIRASGTFESNGAQTIQTSTGNLTIATAGGNGDIILSPNGTGKVGIGISTPEAQGLNVAGGGVTVSLDTGSARKILELYATSTGAKVSSTYVGASSYGSLELLTSNTPRLTITAGGDSTFSGALNGTSASFSSDIVVNGVNIGRGGGSIDTNTRVGVNSINANTTGVGNTAIGWASLFSNTTGGSNVSVGRDAGRFIADGTTANTITNNSIFIGRLTRSLADNQINQIVIGFQSIGLGSNTTVIGNSSSTFGRWWGNLLIGDSTNTGEQLQVTGSSKFTGAATFSSSVSTKALSSTTSGAGNLTAYIGNSVTSASGSTGYGLAIESEASAATSYALTVRNLAGSNTYFHVSTETGKVGNVGIGTASPAHKLVVEGTVPRILAKDSLGAIAQMLGINNSEVAFGSQTNHPVRILVNDVDVARFTTDGYLRMAASTGGIQFNGDTAAANALDDYEEGTWTPTLIDSSNSSVYSSGLKYGFYTKVGRVVTATAVYDATTCIAGSSIRVGGLPFTVTSSVSRYPAFNSHTTGTAISSATIQGGYAREGETNFQLLQRDSSSTVTFVAGTFSMFITIIYVV